MDYRDFLEEKRIVAGDSGFDAQGISTVAFPFQNALIKWAINHDKNNCKLHSI